MKRELRILIDLKIPYLRNYNPFFVLYFIDSLIFSKALFVETFRGNFYVGIC